MPASLEFAVRDPETGRLSCPECEGTLMGKNAEYWSVRTDKEGSQSVKLYNHDLGEIDIICDCDDVTWAYEDMDFE